MGYRIGEEDAGIQNVLGGEFTHYIFMFCN